MASAETTSTAHEHSSSQMPVRQNPYAGLRPYGKTSLLYTLVIPDLRDQGAQVVYFDDWAEDG